MQVRSEAHRHADLLHLFHLQRGPTHTDGQVIDPALSLVSHHRGGVREEGGGRAGGDILRAERCRAFLKEKNRLPQIGRLITDFQTRFDREDVAVSVLPNICPDLPLDRFKSQADVCKLLLSRKQLGVCGE